jgi:hypothetical protein
VYLISSALGAFLSTGLSRKSLGFTAFFRSGGEAQARRCDDPCH